MALGFTDNDGVAALAAAVGRVVLLATMSVLAGFHNEPLISATCHELTSQLRNSLLVLNQRCDYDTLSRSDCWRAKRWWWCAMCWASTRWIPGVLGGISIGGIVAALFNRYHRIELPEYLAFSAANALCRW